MKNLEAKAILILSFTTKEVTKRVGYKGTKRYVQMLMVQTGTTRLAVRDKATGRPAGTLSMERILAAITQRTRERA
mgnify:CR=1 FL=1